MSQGVDAWTIHHPGFLAISTPRGGIQVSGIYRDDADRAHFSERLEELVVRFCWKLHACVPMDSHSRSGIRNKDWGEGCGELPGSDRRLGRDMALLLGRREGGLKLGELGELCGGFDHRSVGGALKKAMVRLGKDQVFQSAHESEGKRLAKG